MGWEGPLERRPKGPERECRDGGVYAATGMDRKINRLSVLGDPRNAAPTNRRVVSSGL